MADAYTVWLGPAPTTTPNPSTGPAGVPVRLPNIITPNGDGRNDAFAISDLPPGAWQLHIYSRWGRLVYQTENYQSNWSAEGLAAGLYYYQLKTTGQMPYQRWVEVVRWAIGLPSGWRVYESADPLAGIWRASPSRLFCSPVLPTLTSS